MWRRLFTNRAPWWRGLAPFLGLPIADKALEAIAPEAFHFEDDCRDALAHFEEFFPQAAQVARQLKQFDLLHPVPIPDAIRGIVSSIDSEEARLIEFEENHGLRSKAKKMLIRSIGVDRKRTTDLYGKLAEVNAEKDHLIEDLSRLNEGLKRKIIQLQGRATISFRRPDRRRGRKPRPIGNCTRRASP